MLILLVVVTLVAGCGGSRADTDPPASPAAAVSPASAPAVRALFRACHRRSDGSLALVIRFETDDPSALGDYAGDVGIDVEVIDPATWASTGEAPEVRPGLQNSLRPLRVPAGEAPPQELTFRASVVPVEDPSQILAANDVTVFVSASSCDHS